MSYNENRPDFLTKEVLTQDEDFINDASAFLYKRTGEVLTEPEKVYEKYLEHMRISDVNEATTVQDYYYAQRAEDEDKAEMARLYHAYDKMEMFRSGEGVGDAFNRFTDYAEGILTAPSTLVGILTGGAAKAGAMVGQAVAKTAVRKALISSLTKKGAIRAAGVEGAVAAVQDVGRQATQLELSEDTGVTIREEYSPLETGINVTLSSGLGGVLGGANAYRGSVKEATAQRRAAIGVAAEKRGVAPAVEEARKVLEASKLKVRPIDELKVQLGDKIRSEKLLTPLESVIAQLDDDTITRIQAAATEFAENIDIKTYSDGTRQSITEAISDAIGTEKLGTDRWANILDKYKLTNEQFGLVFAADVSRAARLLNKQSQIARVKALTSSIESIAGKVQGSVGEEALDQYSAMNEALKGVASGAQGWERMRRAMLTSQLQTTMRNIVGGGARVFVDAMNVLSEQTLRTITSKLNIPYTGIETRGGVGDIFKYMINQEEAQVIVDAYSRQMPQQAQYLFSNFVDGANLGARTGAGGAFEKVGTWLNFANRYADNYYKRAIFSGELNRLTKVKFDKDIIQLLQDGEFSKITPEMFKAASDKSLELLYQKTPSKKTAAGRIANTYLDIDKMAGVGMLTGLVLPFPRFVFNQIKFMTEYAPVIGLMMPGASTPQKLAKQLTGFGLIGGFAAFRSTQPDGSNWYEYTRENGQTADLRPTLAGLSLPLYLGDLLHRQFTGQQNEFGNEEYGKILKQVQELSLGTAFRAGQGSAMTDRYIPDILDAVFGEGELDLSTSRVVGTAIGDLFATFTYSMPMGIARDLFQMTDEENRQVGETRENVGLLEILYMRATRGLPEPMRPERSPRFEITSPQPTRAELPLAAPVTGMTISRAKNALEEEMARLRLTSYDLYKPVPFGPADVAIRKALSERLPQLGVEAIQSPRYRAADTDGERRDLLRNELLSKVNEIKKDAFEDLRARIESGEETRFTIRDLLKFEFESTGTKAQRRNFKPLFKKRTGQEFNDSDPEMLKRGLIILQDYIDSTKRLAEGGFVSDDPMMPRDVDDQMSELDMAKVPASLRGYVGWKSDLAEVEKEFQSGERNIAEYILGTGYYGVAKPIEDVVSAFIPDAIEEGVSKGIASFMEFTGVDKALEKLSPRTRRNLNEMMGMSGFATPARTLTRQTNPTINKARAGRDLSSADVIIPNYYSNKLDKQVQFPGAQITKKFLGEDKAIKHNQIAGAAQWGTKAGARVIANMFNPSARALYKEYGISSVFKKNYNLVQKELKKLEKLRSSKASAEDIGKQEMIIQSILEVTQAEMIQTSHIRRQANAQATVEDVPMKFALAAADPNVPEVYFRPAQIGDDWYEKTAAQAPTAGRQISKEDADFVQEHIERVWKNDGGYDRNRVQVIAKVPASKFTGAHMESIKTSKQLNIIENAFRPEGGRGFVEFRPGKDGKLIKTYNVDKLKESIIKVNEEAPKNKKVKIEKTDDSGVWVSFSHAGRGKVEGGINVLVRVDVNGNIDGYVSDLHDFLDGVPIIGDLLNNALPTQILAVTAPMQTNVYSISTLRSALDKNKKLKAVYGENVVGRFEDFPKPPEAASKTATLERITEAAKIKPSALGVAKEVLPVAGNVTFAANVLADNEEEDTRKRGGLMSRK
jgi:hypothetical protein